MVKPRRLPSKIWLLIPSFVKHPTVLVSSMWAEDFLLKRGLWVFRRIATDLKTLDLSASRQESIVLRTLQTIKACAFEWYMKAAYEVLRTSVA